MTTPIIVNQSNQLTTSLAEIRSFNPCALGWRDILYARKPSCNADYNTQFPLVECLESNSVSDVCWLIGKRKKEIQICVRFARMCADSVKHLNSKYAADAAAYDVADAYADCKQKELNKQFLIQCINEY